MSIHNRFHARRANNGKTTILSRVKIDDCTYDETGDKH